MNKLDLYYPILNIIREESKRYEYKPDTDQHIVVVDEDGCEFATISMNKFLEESSKLLAEIKKSKRPCFYTFFDRIFHERDRLLKDKGTFKRQSGHSYYYPRLAYKYDSALGI